MEKESEYYFEITPKTAFSFGWRELMYYKELFYFFTWRDVKVKYKQTVLGLLWAALQPLIMMVIFSFLLGNALSIPSDSISYPVFAYSGLILWTVFSSGITNAGNSMIANSQIIKKIYFPRLIIPISSILVAAIDFFVAFIVLFILLVVFHQEVNVYQAMLFWPAGFVVTMLSSFGPGCLLAALNVKYRDFRYVIPFVVQSLLFVTPVFYPISLFSGSWIQYLLALNPMYSAITLFRSPMMPGTQDITLVLISLASCLVLFVLGIAYFRKTEMYFADLA